MNIETSTIDNEKSESVVTETNKKCDETSKNENKKGILYKLGNVSDKTISLLATLAMFVLLFAPALMSVIDMFKQSIDFTLAYYIDIIQVWAFPIVSVIVFIIYLLVFLQIRNRGIDLLTIVKKNPVFVIFSISVVLMVISQITNDTWTVEHSFYMTVVGESFDMEITYFIFILFGATQVRKEAHKRFLLRSQLFISILVVIAAFVLWHAQDESRFFMDWYVRLSGIFTNGNYFGYYLAISIPIAASTFVYEKQIVWKIISGVSFIVNVCALSINHARGTILGVSFAIAFIILSHLIIERKINWQTLVIVPVFILFMIVPNKIYGDSEPYERPSIGADIANFIEGNEAAGSDRLKLWRQTVNIIKDYKWLGIGFEGIAVKDVAFEIDNGRPHNEFLQYALFHGIPMAITYFVGCLGVFIRALRKRKIIDGATLVCLSGALGYLINSFFGLTVFSTAMYLFVFMGMGYVRDDLNMTTKEKELENVESI